MQTDGGKYERRSSRCVLRILEQDEPVAPWCGRTARQPCRPRDLCSGREQEDKKIVVYACTIILFKDNAKCTHYYIVITANYIEIVIQCLASTQTERYVC